MTTSLASSPVVPIATAVVAAGLIFGTLSSSSSSDAADAATGADSGLPAPEDPTALAPADTGGAAAAPAGDATAACKANSCTITFPTEGGTVSALGTTITAVKFYGDGITLTVGSTQLITNLTTPAKGGGYTAKAVSVQSGAQSTHVVKVTKSK